MSSQIEMAKPGDRGRQATGGSRPATAAILLRTRRKRVRAGVIVAVVWLSVLIFAATFADVIPGLPDVGERVGGFAQPPEFTVAGLLGTDGVGRSTLARAIYGARISLTIAICSTAVGLLLGVIIGLVAGYYRGVVEGASTIVVNTISALPPLLLLLALVAAMGASLFGITIALAIVVSDIYIRVTKGAVIANASREYVLAARSLGATDFRILVREILPNLVPVLGAVVPIAMASMIIAEGSLSFLGYGIPAPNPSWGGMIAAGADIMRQYPLAILAPVGFLVLTVYSFNALGDYLSSRADVRDANI